MKEIIKILLVTCILCLLKPETNAQQQVRKQPNVLFIMVDDLRPDPGCYGNTEIHSPNMDRLAFASVLFKKQYAAIPTCGVSRAAILTGYLPRSKAALSNEACVTLISNKPKMDQPKTFISNLKEHGYYTVGIKNDLYVNINIATKNPYTLTGSRVMISVPQYSWEKNGSPINEGPEILKNKDSDVFLIFSGSGYWTVGYCLGMLKLKKDGNPLDPSDWKKNRERVFKGNDAASAFAPGHNGFLKSRDGSEDWIIYHVRSFANGGSTNYRNLRIQQFIWNQDGTPNFGKPITINQALTTPSGEF